MAVDDFVDISPNDTEQKSHKRQGVTITRRYWCPIGHLLPNKGPDGKDICTRRRCADTQKPPDRASVALVKRDPAQVLVDEGRRLAALDARAKAWLEKLGIPLDLTGADAEEWADGTIVACLPIAVGLIKRDLMFGNNRQQSLAAQKILDATGRGRRDPAAVAIAPIIIINGANGSADPPWRRVQDVPEEAVVNAVAPALPSPSSGEGDAQP